MAVVQRELPGQGQYWRGQPTLSRADRKPVNQYFLIFKQEPMDVRNRSKTKSSGKTSGIH